MLKFCSCRACRAGRSCPRNRAKTEGAKRTFRRQTKTALRKGEEPPKHISVTYTD
jgi:hypothetical protein